MKEKETILTVEGLKKLEVELEQYKTVKKTGSSPAHQTGYRIWRHQRKFRI